MDDDYELLKNYKNQDLEMSKRFEACMKLANFYLDYEKSFDKAFPWLMKSYTEFERIEGLIQLVKYYMSIDRVLLAYSLCLVCFFTKKIEGIGCSDFVYEFEVNYLLASLSMKLHKYDEANAHIKRAIDNLREDFDMYEEYSNSCREIFVQSADKMR